MVPVADSLDAGESVVDAAPAVTSPVAESAVKAKVLPAAEPVKGMSFGEAFKAARAAGKKAFDWNGKSFTTSPTQRLDQRAQPVALARI